LEYYPFGLNQNGDWYATISPENKYQYNGKELDTDLNLNWLDYGARYYDPAIGRWGQIDPHADTYFSQSPFNYVANNPISFIDPTGMDLIFYLSDSDKETRENAFNQLLSLLNHALDGGSFNLSATKDGGFSLSLGEMKDGAKDYSHIASYYLNQIVNDDFTTKVNVTSSNQDIQVGSYYSNKIDVADISQFPDNQGVGNNNTGTKAGKLMHELYEQYDKQKNNRSNSEAGFNISHAVGKMIEAGVDGLMRVPFNNEANYYIYPQYAVKTKQNSIGRRTKYYNPSTGEYYIESALFFRGGTNNPLGTLQLAKPIKSK
jgi:RHS repeat-associated protein